MKGINKALFGCFGLAVLAVLGMTALTGMSWGTIRRAAAEGARGEKLALSEALSTEFGSQPTVEFVCRLPVVEAAPCALVGDGRGTREVTLTFSSYEPAAGVTHEELARRIAQAAHKLSTFAGQSDRIEIIIKDGSESASLERKFSFGTQELAAPEASPRQDE